MDQFKLSPFNIERLAALTYSAMLNNEHEQFYFKDLESRFILLSKKQATRLGLDKPEEAIGKTDFDFFSKIHAQQAYNDEQRIIATGAPILNKVEIVTWESKPSEYVISSKYPLQDENGNIIGTWGHTIRFDELPTTSEGLSLKASITDNVKDISHSTKTDELTFLPNAKVFFNAMNLFYQKAMNQLNAKDRDHALILIDIEGFKSINDSYGYSGGNAALVYTADLLRNIVKGDSTDKIFMYGTNSFAIITDICSIDDAIKISESIIQTADIEPFQYNDTDMTLLYNIGLCTFKEALPFGTIYDIINLADGRLAEAKKSGSNNIIYERR